MKESTFEISMLQTVEVEELDGNCWVGDAFVLENRKMSVRGMRA